MNFGGIQKSSTIDFPGLLSCVLFTRGCNLDCFYCHNRELLSSGDEIHEQEIISFLIRRQGLLDGVVISGGEPTIQPDIESFLKTVRSLNYNIKLDTNGQRPDVVEALGREGLLDYVAVDVKAKKDDYKTVCRSEGFENALKTVSILKDLGIRFEVRTTLYPSMKLEDLCGLFSEFPEMPAWRLNYFHMPLIKKNDDEELLNAKALTPQVIERASEKLKALQPNLI